MNLFRRPILGALLLSMAALACSGEARNEASESGSGSSVGYDRRAVAPSADVAARQEQVSAVELPKLANVQADTAPATAAPAPQMIIRNGTATVRVDEMEPAVVAVGKLAERLGGYVANTSVTSGADEDKVATIEVKVPSARFDQALAGLSPIGRMQSQETTSEDVGEEYADMSARMANARRLEARLLALLESRTGRLEDVLAVERELARVREEVERAEGRLRFLRSRVALSTLTITLREGESNRIGEAFGEAWRNFVDFVVGFVVALGWLIPLLIVLAILWRVVRWLFRNRPPGRPWWQRPDTAPPLPRRDPPAPGGPPPAP